MTRAALALLLATLVAASGGCKKSKKAAPADPQRPPPMSVEEAKRSEDACKAYVEKVCACGQTIPKAAEECTLARALPSAVRIALEVSANPETKPDVIYASQSSVRKTTQECIERTAALPTLGCPQ